MDVIYTWSDHFGCATEEWGYAFYPILQMN